MNEQESEHPTWIVVVRSEVRQIMSIKAPTADEADRLGTERVRRGQAGPGARTILETKVLNDPIARRHPQPE